MVKRAGVRDSALTIHGSLQAERLGKFLANTGLTFTHIFVSDLQRAVKTADAIRSWTNAIQPGSKLELTKVKLLREQDFGFYEGKPFYARPRDSSKSGKENHRSHHQDDPGFQDVESKESMAHRMDEFLRDHLVPLIYKEAGSKGKAIAMVSHGIILTHLWRRFLGMLGKGSVSVSPGISFGSGAPAPLESLGGWSNTGYLELEVLTKSQAETTNRSGSEPSSKSHDKGNPSSSALSMAKYRVCIKTVNGKTHLQGLKRTKGGVGSAKFDEGQKSIDSFFKKRKRKDGED
ncbi:hypothetical protein ACLMJK_005246 [Lecanora helva]